jgi:putative membrane protein
MALLTMFLVGLVAIEHLYFLILEMWLWQTPRAMKAFGTTPDYAAATAALAANQGLYNGFLAAGLIWSLFSVSHGFALQIFFLSCIIVAGLYGAATVKPVIAIVQALPAAIALGFILFAGP